MKQIFLFFFALALIAAPELQAKPLANLNGQDITEEEVMKIANTRMMKILSQMYDIKRATIEDIIDSRLLEKEAKEQGKTVPKLRAEIQNKAPKATETEVKSIYEVQKRRFKGKSFEQVKNQLTNQINRQKRQMALNEYLDGLRKGAKIQIHLERPRAKVSVDDDPSIGKKDAPITLIEFSEFQCPFCKRARPTIEKILETYKGKINYVFRDYPLSFHKQAKDAANAANCAGDQNKYWEYSKELWATQGKHSIDQLKAIAKKLSLDSKKFDKCVDNKTYFAEIDKDQRDGAAVGVTGTPAYFINGKFLSGAQPFEKFKQLIDEEL